MREITNLTSPGFGRGTKLTIMKRPTREELMMPVEAPPREIQAMRELLNDIEKYQRAEGASIAAQLISILISEAVNYKTKLLKE